MTPDGLTFAGHVYPIHGRDRVHLEVMSDGQSIVLEMSRAAAIRLGRAIQAAGDGTAGWTMLYGDRRMQGAVPTCLPADLGEEDPCREP